MDTVQKTPLTPKEVEEKLRKLGEARLKADELKADQKAEIVKAAGKFAAKMVANDTEIEALEEELEDWAKDLLNEDSPTFRCPAGKIALTMGKPKVEYDAKDEANIIAQLKETAPSLLYKTEVISKAAVQAAAKMPDRGLITLAELAGVKVVQEATVKITA